MTEWASHEDCSEGLLSDLSEFLNEYFEKYTLVSEWLELLCWVEDEEVINDKGMKYS